MFYLGRQHFEVFGAVVALVAIDVVDYFSGKQFAPEFDLRQDAMKVASVEFDISVCRACPTEAPAPPPLRPP